LLIVYDEFPIFYNRETQEASLIYSEGSDDRRLISTARSGAMARMNSHMRAPLGLSGEPTSCWDRKCSHL